MSEQYRILVVDDDAAVVEYLLEMLEEAGYACTGTTLPAQALELVEREAFHLVITDVEMPDLRGVDLMELLHQRRPELLIILITAFGSIDLAVRALRTGAVDFVTKPFRIELLLRAIERALDERRMRREIVRLRSRISEASAGSGTIVARSPAMRRILELADRSARADTTVLITGESGVGKGMLARYLHERGPRAERPFVQVNCAAIPPNLIESELFGVRRGAFTDAKEDRPGLFRQADGGTLFLDELAEMPLELQAKLLHVLETRQVRALGASEETAVDVRLIAATNADLEMRLREGRFRPDLYYRLNIIRMDIPPLRQRPEDIEALVDVSLQRACERLGRPIVGVSGDVLRWILHHDWPGNVRELANLIERAVALSEHDVLVMEDLAPGPSPGAGAEDSLDRAARAGVPLAELERRYVRKVLELSGGNKARAADRLGIDRRTLYRKLPPNGGA